MAEHVLYAAIALLLLAPATLAPDGTGRIHRLLAWRPLVLLGLISYAIYLYHLPLMKWFLGRGEPERLVPTAPTLALLAFGVVSAIVCAALSYWLLERPLLARRRLR
ncbi:MAG: hypothetical protein H0V81_12610 [Solirubrobacterales bacterium]|nr:hypothetical protein [Solirubrobacterales bacterium]